MDLKVWVTEKRTIYIHLGFILILILTNIDTNININPFINMEITLLQIMEMLMKIKRKEHMEELEQ